MRTALLLTVHLFGLTTLLGSVVVSSLHLLCRFQSQKPAVQMRREITVLVSGLVLSMCTGALILPAERKPITAGTGFA
jgi:hypothetical protein